LHDTSTPAEPTKLVTRHDARRTTLADKSPRYIFDEEAMTRSSGQLYGGPRFVTIMRGICALMLLAASVAVISTLNNFCGQNLYLESYHKQIQYLRPDESREDIGRDGVLESQQETHLRHFHIPSAPHMDYASVPDSYATSFAETTDNSTATSPETEAPAAILLPQKTSQMSDENYFGSIDQAEARETSAFVSVPLNRSVFDLSRYEKDRDNWFDGVWARPYQPWWWVGDQDMRPLPLPCFKPDENWSKVRLQPPPAATGLLFVKPYKTASSTGAGLHLRIARNAANRQHNRKSSDAWPICKARFDHGPFIRPAHSLRYGM
jgi:hypothetical protein